MFFVFANKRIFPFFPIYRQDHFGGGSSVPPNKHSVHWYVAIMKANADGSGFQLQVPVSEVSALASAMVNIIEDGKAIVKLDVAA